MTTSEIATLPGYEEFAPWLLVEKRGGVQHASVVGDGRWPLAVMLGASMGIAPWWLRRRRRAARRRASTPAKEGN